MNESYAEAAVKKEPDAKTFLLKGLLWAGVVVLFAASFVIGNQILLLLAAVALVCAIYFIPLLNLEYEVIFCDGQFDFDKIMGGNKRKTMLKLDLENAEILAPVGSHSLDSYNNQKLAVKDYTSGKKDANVYCLVARGGNVVYKVLFEPNEKMITCAKNKSPRKVVEY